MTLDRSTRWLAMALLCLGDLMIVLDVTVVNVALPTIRGDLGFSEAGLAWVVNAYMVTFGGFLLLGGRLGDLYGPRRMFLAGVALFTLASLGCGLAPTQGALVAARAIQGCGGAVVSAGALSLIVTLFQAQDERAKAMGVFGFVSAAGGSIGVMLGGLLTQTLGWHWIFLINVPIGLGVLLASWRLLPADAMPAQRGSLDVAGAFTVTLAMLLAVYAIVGGNEAGWLSPRTLGLLAASLALALAFLAIEARVAAPLVPLKLLTLRGLAIANTIGLLWAAAMFAAFFLSGLYLQLVLHYTPLQVGLAFLPTNLLMAAFSLGLSARIVLRFGNRGPIVAGLAMIAVGLALLARAPTDAGFALDLLPAFVLQGLGAGIALNPLLMAAMGEVGPDESGLASGLINTAFMLGGALGLAVLASLAAARTTALAAGGADAMEALNGGYHAAFWIGAGFAAVATLVGIGVAGRPAEDAVLRPATAHK
jgi:EmrB/QacA subfamily drug resistance transporter